jgi:uncharacterized protein (UPF0548 family)
VVDVPHGGIIGRLGSAALVLPDARVSEAHALVSLRGGALQLLALRGRFAMGAQPLSAISLAPGQRIHFARDLWVDVVDVTLPETVLGLVGDGIPQQPLAGVTSLEREPRIGLSRGYREGAEAVFWNRDQHWHVRPRGEASRVLAVGDVLQLGGCELRVVQIPLARAGQSVTRHRGGIGAPLRIIASFDSVHLHREGVLCLALGGKLARLVSELVEFDGPVPWPVLAGELWRGAPAHKARRNLDQTLLRLRRKLEAAGVRPDLVSSDGAGCVELRLAPGDAVEARS